LEGAQRAPSCFMSAFRLNSCTSTDARMLCTCTTLRDNVHVSKGCRVSGPVGCKSQLDGGACRASKRASALTISGAHLLDERCVCWHLGDGPQRQIIVLRVLCCSSLVLLICSSDMWFCTCPHQSTHCLASQPPAQELHRCSWSSHDTRTFLLLLLLLPLLGGHLQHRTPKVADAIFAMLHISGMGTQLLWLPLS
jgi:hypothetical protein